MFDPYTKAMYQQGDSRANNNRLCGFSHASFRAAAVIQLIVWESYTDSDIVKLDNSR